MFSYATVAKTIMSPTLHSSVAISPMKDKANVNTRDAKSTHRYLTNLLCPTVLLHPGVKIGGPSVPSENIETSSENRKLAVVIHLRVKVKVPLLRLKISRCLHG